MKNYKKQRGVTMVAIAAGLALLAFFVMIALTLVPVYMENFSVSSHVSRLAKDSRTKEMTKDEIKKTLIKRLGIDDVKNVTQQDIIVSEISGGYRIEVDYEVRKSFLGNIDVAVHQTPCSAFQYSLLVFIPFSFFFNNDPNRNSPSWMSQTNLLFLKCVVV